MFYFSNCFIVSIIFIWCDGQDIRFPDRDVPTRSFEGLENRGEYNLDNTLLYYWLSKDGLVFNTLIV